MLFFLVFSLPCAHFIHRLPPPHTTWFHSAHSLSHNWSKRMNLCPQTPRKHPEMHRPGISLGHMTNMSQSLLPRMECTDWLILDHVLHTWRKEPAPMKLQRPLPKNSEAIRKRERKLLHGVYSLKSSLLRTFSEKISFPF